MNIPEKEEQKQVFLLFHVLARSTQVLPQLFQLSGIWYDQKAMCEHSGFAIMYKGVYHNSSQAVTIKVFQKLDTEIWGWVFLLSYQAFTEVKLYIIIKELTLWAHLSHPQILPFYGFLPPWRWHLPCFSINREWKSPWVFKRSLRVWKITLDMYTSHHPLIIWCYMGFHSSQILLKGYFICIVWI